MWNSDFFKKTFKLSGNIRILVLTVGLISGGAIDHFAFLGNRGLETSVSRIRLDSPNFKFINPILAADTLDKKQFLKYRPLEKEISDYIKQAQASSQLEDAGVYYRDLTDGSWTGVNEDEKFSPGSLQKVPLLIAYLKKAETEPGALDIKIVNKDPQDENQAPGSEQSFKPSKIFQYNQTATVRELLQLMVSYSDNNATGVLYNNSTFTYSGCSHRYKLWPKPLLCFWPAFRGQYNLWSSRIENMGVSDNKQYRNHGVPQYLFRSRYLTEHSLPQTCGPKVHLLANLQRCLP
ncbi:MAG: class A beta-lactamase-related serine hydrolase [Patescibacteria group bacterium]|nr:class A beta-lactamase-related serine hydrolase [Patescibacteria group bacterium]